MRSSHWLRFIGSAKTILPRGRSVDRSSMAITLDSSCLHTSVVTIPEFKMHSSTFRHVLKKATFISLSSRQISQILLFGKKSCIDIRSHNLNDHQGRKKESKEFPELCVFVWLRARARVCVCKDTIELEISRLSYTKRQLIRVCYIGDLSD